MSRLEFARALVVYSDILDNIEELKKSIMSYEVANYFKEVLVEKRELETILENACIEHVSLSDLYPIIH